MSTLQTPVTRFHFFCCWSAVTLLYYIFAKVSCMNPGFLQALRRFENLSSIRITGAAKIADLAMVAVELEEDAGAWRVSLQTPYLFCHTSVRSCPLHQRLQAILVAKNCLRHNWIACNNRLNMSHGVCSAALCCFAAHK